MINLSKLIELQEKVTNRYAGKCFYEEAKNKRKNGTCENCTWFKYPPTNLQCIGCYKFDKWRKDE